MRKYFEETIWWVLVSFGLIAVIMLLPGCKSEEVVATPLITKGNCQDQVFKVATINQGIITMPTIGKIVEESHYQSQEDVTNGATGYPRFSTDGVSFHLSESCKLYQKHDPQVDCKKLYAQPWEKVWTPSENGNIGQGSMGNYRPTLAKELWQGNMWLKKNVPLNTRLLAQANGKSVVLYFGHELGPAEDEFIAGMSVEAHAWLGTNNDSKIKLSYLKDQTLPFGPINCQ